MGGGRWGARGRRRGHKHTDTHLDSPLNRGRLVVVVVVGEGDGLERRTGHKRIDTHHNTLWFPPEQGSILGNGDGGGGGGLSEEKGAQTQ